MKRSFPLFCRISLASLVAASGFGGQPCLGQAEPAGLPAGSASAGAHPSPVMGFNLAVEETGVHNSATGWADDVTPTVSYRFNHHISLDASVPWFPIVDAYITRKNADAAPMLRTGTDLFGDTYATGNFEAQRTRLNYMGSAVLALPTGNVRYGLGAGSTTYNITNHFDYSLAWFTPDVEFGEGNNSSLANPTVRKAYVATGPLANFQAGGTFDLPFSLEFDLEAYEDLPLGSQTVHGTVTHKGKHGAGYSTAGLEGAQTAEDNGLNAELDLPVGAHVVLMGVYERSFVQGLDTASVGLTWTLRAPRKP